MDRNQHLQWSKDRAQDASTGLEMWALFVLDMHKHDELAKHIAISLGNTMFMINLQCTTDEVSKFIDGFN